MCIRDRPSSITLVAVADKGVPIRWMVLLVVMKGMMEMVHSRACENEIIDLQTIANLACFGQRKL